MGTRPPPASPAASSVMFVSSLLCNRHDTVNRTRSIVTGHTSRDSVTKQFRGTVCKVDLQDPGDWGLEVTQEFDCFTRNEFVLT